MIRNLCLLSATLWSFAALSHHGLGGRYDQETVAELEGVVSRVLWRNPHVRITLTTSDNQDWDIEAGSPTVLQRRSITEDMVSAGDRIRVAGYASMRGLNEMIVHNILLEDGQELVLSPNRSGGARWSDNSVGEEGNFMRVSVGDPSRPDLGIFRVWSTTTADPGSYPLFPENGDPELAGRYALTTAARNRLASFDPATDNPMEAYCQPKGMPMVMEQPFPMEFVRNEDSITMRLEEYDTVRTVYMTDPPAPQPSLLGHSIGHWEDATLVVMTTDVDWPYFNQMGVTQSTQARIVERFTPSEDGSRLSYRLTVTDPETFTAPAVLEKFWVWLPDIEVVKFNCTENE